MQGRNYLDEKSKYLDKKKSSQLYNMEQDQSDLCTTKIMRGNTSKLVSM
jgi:hypothetical protein